MSPKDCELTAHPVQEVVTSFIFLFRAGGDASVFDFHMSTLLHWACVRRINCDIHFESRVLYTRPRGA